MHVFAMNGGNVQLYFLMRNLLYISFFCLSKTVLKSLIIAHFQYHLYNLSNFFFHNCLYKPEEEHVACNFIYRL